MSLLNCVGLGFIVGIPLTTILVACVWFQVEMILLIKEALHGVPKNKNE